MWIIYTILVLVILFLIIAKLILSFAFGKRCEGNSNLKYFTADDFEDLNAKPIEFKSNKNQLLRGNIYTNRNVKDYKGLVVFVHGMGAGHLSYTTEINTIAKAGFKVLAYDNTGTCKSEGKSLNGFYQAVLDLKSCLEFIKNEKELKDYKINLIGHSWGAFAVCQILKYRYDIKSVVSLSGPNTVEDLFASMMGPFGKIVKPFIKFLNFLKFGKEGIEPTKEILKKADSSISILLFHGKADKTCIIENSIVYESEKYFENNENIGIIVYEEKCHNIYQSIESEKYLNEVFENIAEYKKKYKGKELIEKSKSLYENIDYKKITEEDSDVMNTIIEFFIENNK